MIRSMASSPAAFIISAWIPSTPGLFLGRSLFIASSISDLRGGRDSSFHLVEVCLSIIGSFSFGFFLYISEQYSTHTLAISFSFMSVFPFLSLIVAVLADLLFVSDFISWYISLLLFWDFSFSIFSHLSLMYCFLSLLRSLLTSLFKIL